MALKTLVQLGKKYIDLNEIVSISPTKEEKMFVVAVTDKRDVWLTAEEFELLVEEITKAKKRVRTKKTLTIEPT